MNNKIVASRGGKIKELINYKGTLIDITNNTLNRTAENMLLAQLKKQTTVWGDAGGREQGLEKLVIFNNKLIATSENIFFKTDPSVGPMEDGKLKEIFRIPYGYEIASILSAKR